MELRPFENLSLEDMKNEVWLDVLNYEDIYQVSNFGRIKTKKRIMMYDKNMGFGISKKTVYPRIRKQKINKHTGYLMVGLNSKGKSRNYTIHSLVGEAFLGYERGPGRDGNKNCVNHKNGNKLDNRLKNLEVITIAENIRHAFRESSSSTAHKLLWKGVEYYSKAEFRRQTGCSEKRMHKMIKSGEIKQLTQNKKH